MSKINDSCLAVPHICQITGEEDEKHNDCFPTSGAMLIRAYTGEIVEPRSLYDLIGKKDDEYWRAWQLQKALRHYGIETQWREGLTVEAVFMLLQKQTPFVAVINYGALKARGYSSPSEFMGPHGMVPYGMNIKNLYVHDPLTREATAHGIPIQDWWYAWGQNTPQENPNYSGLVPVLGLEQFKSAQNIDETDAEALYAVRVEVGKSRLRVRNEPMIGATIVGYLHTGAVKQVYAEHDDGLNTWVAITPSRARWIARVHKGTIYGVRV